MKLDSHGSEAHSFVLVWHVLPNQPLAQEQLKSATRSIQVPPFWQVTAAQSSMFVPHSAPINPLAHVHVAALIPSTQVAPVTIVKDQVKQPDYMAYRSVLYYFSIERPQC